MKKILVTLILIIFITITSYSEMITLEECIIRSHDSNLDLEASRQAYQSARWEALSALTGFFPRISFNASLVRIDDETYEDAREVFALPVYDLNEQQIGVLPMSAAMSGQPIFRTTYTSDITIQQPVFNGGKNFLNYQMGRILQKQSEENLKMKKQELDYMVASTFLGLLNLYDLKELSERSIRSSHSHLEMMISREEAGTARRSDVLQWQTKLMNDRTGLTEIENNISSMKELLLLLIGSKERDLKPQKLDTGKILNEVAEYANLAESDHEREIEGFLENVVKTSPELQAMSYNLDLGRKNYQFAVSNFLPSLNIQFTYGIEQDDQLDLSGDNNWNLALVMSLPLFSGGYNYTRLKQAGHDLKRTEMVSDYYEQNYLNAARDVFNKLLTKASAVLDNQAALELAEENHGIVNDLFAQGMVTNSELLDAELMLFVSEMNLISSYYEFIRTRYEMKKYRLEEGE